MNTATQTLYAEGERALGTKLRRCGAAGQDLRELSQSALLVGVEKQGCLPANISGAKRWFNAVGSKLCANWRRRACRTYEVLDMDAVENALAEPDEDTEAKVARLFSVREALAKLRPEELELLWHCDVLDEPLSCVAARLGCSKSWAHLQLLAARDRLRSQLVGRPKVMPQQVPRDPQPSMPRHHPDPPSAPTRAKPHLLVLLLRPCRRAPEPRPHPLR